MVKLKLKSNFAANKSDFRFVSK